ncbi:MAG: MaoC/PaaZ C-terminal domain-containing protein [Aliidongia sp.]
MPRIEGYEDLAPGQRFALGAVTIERADIFEFAAVYDPQPFHLDDAAAEASIFRGLAASGFQTTAAAFSVSVRSGFLAEVNLGGSGLDALRWLRPVRPDAMLSLVWTIEEVTPDQAWPRYRPNPLRSLERGRRAGPDCAGQPPDPRPASGVTGQCLQPDPRREAADPGSAAVTNARRRASSHDGRDAPPCGRGGACDAPLRPGRRAGRRKRQ